MRSKALVADAMLWEGQMRAEDAPDITIVNGSAFDENATYTIATSDFISAGGDSYHAFAVSSQDTMKGTDGLTWT